MTARALQLGERLDIKGLERADSFSKNPLAFRTPSGGTVVLFKMGTAVFIGLTPVEEEDMIRGLGERIKDPLKEEAAGEAYVLDAPIDRKNEGELLAYLQQKYATPPLMQMDVGYTQLSVRVSE